jgi:hypothetical protein
VKCNAKAKAPSGNAWTLLDAIDVGDGVAANRWINGGLIAVSGYETAEFGKAKMLVPQFHVSVSEFGRRPTDDAVRSVLADFGMEGAEEDNHVPGVARHFWLVEGVAKSPECDCKETQERITEPDGFVWQKERA